MKNGRLTSAATQKKRRLFSDTRGSMTIPGLIFFTGLMAVGGLAIDMQRVYGVHGQMQAYVDDVALAAAAELDGQGSAMTRSFRAAYGDGTGGPLVTGPANSAQFATTTTLTVQKVTFLREIGQDPGPLVATPVAGDIVLCKFESGGWTPANCSTTVALAQDARFVEIVAAPRTVSYLVLPIANALGTVFGAGTLQASVQGIRATAGFRRAICNNTPMMICNPSEATTPNADFNLADVYGKQFLVKLNDGWEPPNFGLLDTFPGTGANAMAEALGKVNPLTVCTEDEVLVRTGAVTGPVEQGMNTRFDMYGGSFNNENKSPDYAPAPNVVRGLNSCGNNPSPETTSMPLPRDDCFMAQAPNKAGGCGTFNGGDPRFGDGHWAREQYWRQNHGATMPTDTINGVSYIDGGSSIGGWTRYQTYRYELTHPVDIQPNGEKSAPSCSNQTPDPLPDKDRRILYMAVVNCVENEDSLGHGPIPVKAYAKVFLTEPVGNTAWSDQLRTINGVTLRWGTITNKDIAVEIVDVVKPNDKSGHLHVYPVLYR